MHNPISSISLKGSTSVFIIPSTLLLCLIALSFLVVFQYPTFVAQFNFPLVKYFFPQGQKKVPLQIPILEQRHICNTSNKQNLIKTHTHTHTQRKRKHNTIEYSMKWVQMQTWEVPQSKLVQVKFNNYFGMEILTLNVSGLKPKTWHFGLAIQIIKKNKK